MKKIVVFGAGLSATYLISYLESNAEKFSWELVVADMNLELAKSKCKNNATTCVQIDIHNEDKVIELLQGSALAVSMLPASLHLTIAHKCLDMGIHLATASYLDRKSVV